MLKDYKKESFDQVIRQTAAEFILQQSNGRSMITVTNIKTSSDFKKTDIFVTIFPETMEKEAFDFLQRKLSEFRDFVKSKTRLQYIPQFSFKIDLGEKNRQLVEEKLTGKPEDNF